jgi:hypothetical protein
VEQIKASTILAGGVFLLASGAQAQQQTRLSSTEALAIATEAYVYGYSLVTSDVTRLQMSNVPAVEALKAPLNQFINV